MAGNSNTINIALRLTDQGVVKSIRQVGAEAKKAGDQGSESFDDMNESSTRLTAGLSKAGLALGAMAVAGAAIWAMKSAYDLLSDSVSEYVELAKIQEESEAKLSAVLEATGHAAGFSLEQLQAMAGGLQQITTYGDETTLSAMAVMASFKQIKGDNFEAATKAIMDMSTVMGTDLKSSALQVGKALNDPIGGLGALTRTGVTFTDGQKEMIKSLQKSGDMMGAQKIILDELSTEFGGASAAVTNTFDGALIQAQNALGDTKEELGFVITKNQFFIKVLKLAKAEFEAWGTKIKSNREYLADLAKKGVTLLMDGLSAALEVLRFFTNGWYGLKLAGTVAVEAIAISLEGLFDLLRAMALPLDLVYDGMVEIGLLDVNPFASMKSGFADFSASSREGTAKVISDIETVNRSYDKVSGVIDGWKTAIESIPATQATADDEVIKSVKSVGAAHIKTLEVAGELTGKQIQANIDSINDLTEADLRNLDIRTGRERTDHEEQMARTGEEYEAFKKALDEKAKAEEDALDEANRLKQKAYEKSQKAYEDFSETVQDYTADIISDWDNAGDMLIDIAKRTAAEMAAAFLAEQFIIPIGMSMGSAMGLSWGGTSMTSMLGVANGMTGTGSGFGLPGGTAINWAQSNISGMGWLGSTIPGTASATMASGGASAGLLYPGGASGAVPGGFAGTTFGTALGVGAIGGIGYSMLGGSLGLPQNEWTGLTSGIGSAGGYALGASYGSVGGPIGAVVGAIAGGLLGGLFGGSDPDPDLTVKSGSSTKHPSSTFYNYQVDPDDVKNDDEISSATIDYFDAYFNALDSSTAISLQKILAENAFKTVANFDDYEDDMEGMFTAMADDIFRDIREPLVDALGVSSSMFDTDFFNKIGIEGEDLFATFARFESVAESFADFTGRINDQLATGASLEEAYNNLGIIADMMAMADASIASMSSSSTITALESLIDTQSAYITIMEDAGAKMEELAQVQIATSQELGATITGLNANSLQSGIMNAAKSGNSLAAAVGGAINSALANAVAASTAESIMDQYVSGLNQQVGTAIADLMQTGDMSAEGMTTALAGIFDAFDWDGLENATAGAVDAIQGLIGVESTMAQDTKQLIASYGTMQDVIDSLRGGDLAAVQSVEFMERRYAQLLSSAQEGRAEDVSALAAFTSEYAKWMMDYGGDYADLSSRLIDDMQGVQDAITGGITLDDLYARLTDIESAIYSTESGGETSPPAFAAGGYHDGGIRIVGEDGPELEFTGPSRIMGASGTVNLIAAAVRDALTGATGTDFKSARPTVPSGPINITLQVDRHALGSVMIEEVRHNRDFGKQIIKQIKAA